MPNLTDAARDDTSAEARAGAARSPVNPFSDFFSGGMEDAWDGFSEIPNVRRWFASVERTVVHDQYIYQQPFEMRNGNYVALEGRQYRMLSSYDYLGLIGHEEINKAAIESIQKYNTGTGGVRLLTGSTDLHRTFEAQLAAFKGTEACVTFSSGYVANLAVITALTGPDDLVIIDAKAHRSITDACRMARVPSLRFKHNDPDSLESILQRETTTKRILIIVEGVYSMDGDICPLPEIVALKNRYGANLMVDEAHSFGVMGKTGRGIHEHYGIPVGEVDIWMGTLSKAIPSVGGFIAGKKSLIIFLQHGSAPFMFSAACSPPTIAAASAAIRVIKNEPWRMTALKHNAEQLRSGLRKLGLDTGDSCSPVIPVILGDDGNAFRMARGLFDRGIIAIGVTSPAVPRGKARLRLCATATQDDNFIAGVVKEFDALIQT